MNEKRVEKHLYYAYSIILLSTLLCYSLSARCADHSEDENKFDGSEFKVPRFMDTSFAKNDYKELRRSKAGLSKESELASKQEGEKGIMSAVAGKEKGPLKSGGENKLGSDPQGPIVDLPGDWVPDKVDPTSNGGFSIAPFNGTPVPYKLNGHIDIQRGRP